MKKISLFTPCYNEEANIYELYQRVTEVMKQLSQYTYEYIFIDNYSTDNTRTILRKIAAEDKRVKVIFNICNFGPNKSGAYGFFQTTGDISICFACDFQDPPEMIPDFIKKWEEGYKVVWGKKIGSGESRMMFSIRCIYYKILKSIADTRQYENVTGFGLYDKEVMDYLRDMNEKEPSLRNLVSELGYEVGLVEYYQPARKKGKSSYNILKYINAGLNMIVRTSTFPLRCATIIGIVLAMLSVGIGLFYFIKKVLFWNSFEIGIAPLIISFFFISAIQFIFIGVLGEYVAEVLNRLKKRPMVIEEERLNFDEYGE